MNRLALVVLLLAVPFCQSDEFFYNFLNRTGFILDQVSINALYGMYKGPSLKQSLEIKGTNNDLNLLENHLRRHIALQVRNEVLHRATELQHLVNIVKNFSLHVSTNLRIVVEDSLNDLEQLEPLSQKFAKDLVSSVQKALNQIHEDLRAHTANFDTISAQKLHGVAVGVAQSILEGTKWVNIETNAFKKLQSLFESSSYDGRSDRSKVVVKLGQQEDVETVAEALEPYVFGKEEQFQAWLQQQLEWATNQAKPHIQNMKRCATEVVKDACEMVKEVVTTTHNFFSAQPDDIGKIWIDIQTAVEGILSFENTEAGSQSHLF